MFDTELLWVTFRDDCSLPALESQSFEDIFAGNKVGVTRARALYECLYLIIEGSQNKRVDFGDWNQLETTVLSHLEIKQRNEACLKQLLRLVPCLSFFITNLNIPAEAQVGAISHIMEGIDFDKISEAKLQLRKLHSHTWTRARDGNEEQGGVSVLGAISEKLLEEAFDNLIDGKQLFKSTNNDIKTYGDFVLMALPNNLWFSVKSGFSRERLLASGYFNDVVGVGFFEKADEFTSLSKVRNFKKVGFLAIYLPDTPVSQRQVLEGFNTYDEVIRSYREREIDAPLNINQTAFFRKLSCLGDDVRSLLDIEMSKRTTIGF